MMAFFNGRKKSRILMTALLIMTLVVTFAMPMSVFAEDITGDGGSQIGEVTDQVTGPDVIDQAGDDSTDQVGSEDIDQNTGAEDTDQNIGGEGTDLSAGSEGTDQIGSEGTDLTTDDEVTGETTDDEELGVPELGGFGGMMMTLGLPVQPVYTITLEKTVSPATASPGDTVTYTFRVKNTGTGDLKNVTVTDPMFGSSWKMDFGNLDKGKTKSDTKTYAIPFSTPMGELTNNATVIGDNGKSGGDRKEATATGTAAVTIAPAYGITLEKTVSPTNASPGDEVLYTFKVINTGLKDLKKVTVTDPMFGQNWELNYGDINSGEFKTRTQKYTIPTGTPMGEMTNTATAKGKDQKNNVVATDSDTAVVTIAQAYGITFVKTVSPATASPGDEVTYTFTVTNTGTKDLKDVTVKDPMFGNNWEMDFNNLDNGKTESDTNTYTIPIDTPIGDMENTATVTGKDSDRGGKVVASATGSATVRIIPANPEDPNPPQETVYNYTVHYKLMGEVPLDLYTVSGTAIAGPITITEPDGKINHDLYELYSLSSDVTFNFHEGQTEYEETVWYDLKTQEPPQETVYHYTVDYVVTGSGVVLYEITGSTMDESIVITEPEAVANNSAYQLYSETGSVTFNFNAEQTEYTATVWYAPVPVVEEPPQEPAHEVGNYLVRYWLAGSAEAPISVAEQVEGNSSASAITINPPVLFTDYTGYVPANAENAVLNTDGSVTISYDPETNEHVVTVWYGEGETTDPGTSDPGTPDGTGSDNPVTIRDEETPAGPVIIENEETPAGPLPQAEDTIILEDSVPAGPLPQTGGVPALLLYGLGTLLTGGGATLKLKNRKNEK